MPTHNITLQWPDLFLVISGMINMHLGVRPLPCFCRMLGLFAMHTSMVLLLLMLMFLSAPQGGVGPMALMLDMNGNMY